MWEMIVSVPDHCLSFYFNGQNDPTENGVVSNLPKV